ncbi:MAG: F0F1 ATP synthase subunit delta [Chromatiaceae bacterium]
MAGDITTLARPYAEAAFARAQESGEIPAWSNALNLLGALAGNPAMAEQIANPEIPRDLPRDMLLDLGGETLPTEARNLVKLLAENKRLLVLPEIAKVFEELETRNKGVRQVHIRSAYALDAQLQKLLAKMLKAKLNAEVELTVEKDTSLIGGVEIRADDLVIDGSVRGKLQRLASELQI